MDNMHRYEGGTPGDTAVGIMGWLLYFLLSGWLLYGAAHVLNNTKPEKPPAEAEVLRERVCTDVRNGTIPDYQGEFDDICSWDYMKGAPSEYQL